jgi:phosphotriesterase-related protein
MSEVMTVCGPISPEDLGFTLMHEHLMMDAICFYETVRQRGLLPLDPPLAPDEKVSASSLAYLHHNIVLLKDNLDLNDELLMTSEVDDFARVGGKSILEVSVPGANRQPEALRRISERTGVHIVMSTGLYEEHSWPAGSSSLSVDDLVRIMVGEYENGIDGTSVRPGNIKVAYGEVYTEALDRVLRAAAKTSVETGLPIHVHKGRFLLAGDMRRVADVLLDGGVDPGRVVFCHAQCYSAARARYQSLITRPNDWQRDLLDIDSLLGFLRDGLVLCFDLFGHKWDVPAGDSPYLPDWVPIACLYRLINDGWADQLVVGHDNFLKISTRAFGGEGLTHITNVVLPALRWAGVKEGDIEALTRRNPARILALN